MKELSIEQKAKAYDEAFERVENIKTGKCETTFMFTEGLLEHIFPELKENEDERIRKEIIAFLTYYHTGKGNSVKYDDGWIAWLKKQDKSKDIPADAVLDSNKDGLIADTIRLKPKFKVGDWIIDVQGVLTSQIIGYEDDSYLIKTSCSQFYLPIKLTEKNYRLWTIKDAKDGDVLACESGWTCIFKKLVNDETFSSYCFMDNTKWFCETGSECHTLKEEFVKAYNGKIYPATKEQSNLLFQKMKEAGYKWDAEKKGLKKISQEYPLTPDECIKSSWSEKDEKYLKLAIENFQTLGNSFLTSWLKDLKDRVQPKQEWSVEDETFYQRLEQIVCKVDIEAFQGDRDLHSWLKSLRPQNWTKEDKERYISCLQRLGTGNPEQPETINSKWFKEHVYPQPTWKPSDEMLEALYRVIPENVMEISEDEMLLDKLYQGLKYGRVLSKK